MLATSASADAGANERSPSSPRRRSRATCTTLAGGRRRHSGTVAMQLNDPRRKPPDRAPDQAHVAYSFTADRRQMRGADDGRLGPGYSPFFGPSPLGIGMEGRNTRQNTRLRKMNMGSSNARAGSEPETRDRRASYLRGLLEPRRRPLLVHAGRSNAQTRRVTVKLRQSERLVWVSHLVVL